MQAKIQLRKNRNSLLKRRTAKKIDLLRLYPIALSLLGILAWISGAAFDAGYWSIAGLDNGVTAKTLQQTALTGLIGAFRTWIFGCAVVLLVSIIILILGIKLRKLNRESSGKKRNLINEWLRKKLGYVFDYDAETGVIGVGMMLSVYFFCAVILIPLTLWSLSAYEEGRKSFIRQACSAKKYKKNGFTTVKMAGGAVIEGRMIDHTHTASVLLDGDSVHLVSLTPKPELVYSIALPKIECSGS